MPGNGWKVLKMAGMADMAGNVCKSLEMTGNGWDGWEMLKMAEHSWKWQKMTMMMLCLVYISVGTS